MPESMEKPVDEIAPELEPPLPKWQIGFTDFGILLALTLACMVVGIGVAGALVPGVSDLPEGAEPPKLLVLAQNIGMEFGMLAGMLAFLAVLETREGKQSRAGKRPGKNPFLVGIVTLFVAYIGIALVQTVNIPLLESLGFTYSPQEPVKLVTSGGTLLEKLLLYMSIVVIAPVCEEYVFRGGIFRYFHLRMPLFASAGLSGAIFAAIHADIFAFAPLTVLGAALAIAYRETGKLSTCIAMHAFFNSLSLTVLLTGMGNSQ